MCPFCISALTVAAAKVISAGGGGTVAAKLALNKRNKKSPGRDGRSVAAKGDGGVPDWARALTRQVTNPNRELKFQPGEDHGPISR